MTEILGSLLLVALTLNVSLVVCRLLLPKLLKRPSRKPLLAS
jgi:hypothetical protein